MIAILASMLLPALARAKQKAETIACVNNLRQIDVAYRVWAGAHSDQLPFMVSTNDGGTMELRSVGLFGFDNNSWKHFLVLSNELGSPMVLVCSADHKHSKAADFASFGPANVTYQINTSTNEPTTGTQKVLAWCPIHRTALYIDGHVELPSRRPARSRTSAENP